MGGHEGGRRGDCTMQKLFVPKVQKRIVRIAFVSVYCGGDFFIMKNCGDDQAAIVVVKSLTYVFMYVYLQNAFRNLIVAYPRNLALRIIYHVIRLEFTRALPSHLQPIIERVEKEFGDDPDKNNKKKGENENE